MVSSSSQIRMAFVGFSDQPEPSPYQFERSQSSSRRSRITCGEKDTSDRHQGGVLCNSAPKSSSQEPAMHRQSKFDSLHAQYWFRPPARRSQVAAPRARSLAVPPPHPSGGWTRLPRRWPCARMLSRAIQLYTIHGAQPSKSREGAGHAEHPLDMQVGAPDSSPLWHSGSSLLHVPTCMHASSAHGLHPRPQAGLPMPGAAGAAAVVCTVPSTRLPAVMPKAAGASQPTR
jgi:hypothetical protein